MVTLLDHIVNPLNYADLCNSPNIKTLINPIICGIYFLVNKDEVIYVGKSINIVIRILSHYRSPKIFTSIKYLECNEKDLDKLETHYIVALKPKYNNTHFLQMRINESRQKRSN